MDCPACHQPNIDGARFCAKCGALLPVATDAGADPLINTVVGGRFRIVGVLGEGGMGRVYTGEQQMGTSVRKVAIKTLLSQFARDPQVIARFMREVGTVSELEHPNTIKVYDFGQTATGELYIAMELLSGISLEDALEKGGPLPPERVDRIMGQVCGSLEEAHQKGIIHRDLKPANIYLTKRAGEEDYVKVLDFGIAKRDDRNSKADQKLTQQGTVLGTPPYMSPEQFKGKELDPRSDIYSLGVVTYEMLTGRLPFEADTPWAWATQHMTSQPFPFEATPLSSSVPPKMKAAVMRALSKNADERPQSVREFYEELTLGAGPRLSVLGSMPRGSSDAGGTAMMPARSGQTQIGEPLFPGGPPAAAGKTMLDQPAQAQAQGAPTGSGQALPTPPAAQSHKKGPAPIIAAVAVVAVIGLVIGVVATRKGSGGEDPKPIALPASASAVEVAADPVPNGSAPVAGTTGKPNKPDAPPSTGGTATTAATGKTPAGSGAGEEECRAAINLAAGGNTTLAVNRYRKCDGPSKGAARSAIDESAKRAVNARGCAAKPDANAAASIGATSASNMLKSRRCL
ncbi:MAG: protein kinase [Polyangiaceae bacterium]|nr:protein kinase [Polyangiaceae bacterium]